MRPMMIRTSNREGPISQREQNLWNFIKDSLPTPNDNRGSDTPIWKNNRNNIFSVAFVKEMLKTSNNENIDMVLTQKMKSIYVDFISTWHLHCDKPQRLLKNHCLSPS